MLLRDDPMGSDSLMEFYEANDTAKALELATQQLYADYDEEGSSSRGNHRSKSKSPFRSYQHQEFVQ